MPTSKRVTILDVAKTAGVSAGTASRVLNQREGEIKISQATRDSVLEAARKLGYRPNPFATALRSQKTGLIGAITRDICDPFLAQLAREIQKAARRSGVDMLLAHAEYDLDVIGHHLAFMHTYWFDGLVLLGDIPGDQAVIDELKKTRTPFVMVARGEHTVPPMVNVNEHAGMEIGLNYLRQLGHQRIAFLGNLEHGGVQERCNYFYHYHKEHNLPYEDGYIRLCSMDHAAIIHCVHHLMSLPQLPTAIFCATDQAAFQAIGAVQRLGFSVPADLSILGFDDIEWASYTNPALTTVRQPVEQMALHAIEMLLHLINGDKLSISQKTVLVEPLLVARDSCAAPKVSAG